MAPVKTSPGPAVASPPYPSSASQAMSGTTRLASPRPISYGVGVPARARDHVTTEELLAVTGSSRDTLYQWVAQKLLDRPRIATDANGHQFAVWPSETLERVRFIVASQRQGTKMDDIGLLVEAHWPRRCGPSRRVRRGSPRGLCRTLGPAAALKADARRRCCEAARARRPPGPSRHSR